MYTGIKLKFRYLIVRLLYLFRECKDKFVLVYYLKKNNYKILNDYYEYAKEKNIPIHEICPLSIQITQPSRTISEVVFKILKNIDKQIYSYNRVKEGINRMYLFWYSHLLSFIRYPVQPSNKFLLPNVIISIRDGNILTSDRYIIPENRSEILNLVAKSNIQKEKYTGTFISLLGQSSNNYTHWLTDILPRMTLLNSEERNNVFIIINAQSPVFKIDSLRLLGIKEEKILQLSEGLYALERLLVLHPAQRCNIPHKTHLHQLVDLLKSAVKMEYNKPTISTRIYISRNKNRRKIINEKEIITILKKYNFEKVYCEDLSISEQIKLFSNCNFLISPHGAGLTNQLFCKPRSKIFEIYNPKVWNYDIRGVANSMGHEHWFMFGEPIKNSEDMFVNNDHFEKILQYALETGEKVENDF